MKASRSRGACPARRQQQVHQDCWAPRLEAKLPVLDPRFGLGDLTPAAFSKLIRRGMHPGPGLAKLLTAEAIGRGRGL